MIQKKLPFQAHNLSTFFILFLLVSCQSKPKEPVLEFRDLTSRFESLDKETQKQALENNWAFFSNTFRFEDFEKKLLEEFPSLNTFPPQPVLSGKTFLDFSFTNKKDANPALLLLAIDLEMELLARFHSNDGVNSPRCLESFWSEWGFPVPPVSRGTFTNIDLAENLQEKKVSNMTESSSSTPAKPLNENEERMASYLKLSLGLDKKTDVTSLSSEGLKHGKFKLKTGEVYEIFSSPINCKALVAKESIVPLVGKLTCLQKQSSTWVSFPTQENTLLEDQWALGSQKRCQRWIRPLSDTLHKGHN
ncbi:MAG: hypothetical protein WCK43_03065, partial [bacterium]